MTPAVLLDIDGTLIDSNDAHAHAWVDAFNEAGLDVPYGRIRRSIGMGGDKLMPQVAGIEKDTPEGERISTRRSEIFQKDYLPHIQPFPRVRELLERLAADGYTLVVATSAKKSELAKLLDIAGVSDLIAAGTTSDDAEHSKPDPDIVQAALRRSRVTAERSLMLGDTPYDVEAALRAGIAIVGVESGGWTRDELQGAVEVHPGAAEICQHYDASAFARWRDAR